MIRSHRRLVLAGGAVALALSLTAPASAQDKYPSRPIELVVPTPPGGGTDTTFRQLAELVGPILGQKIVVVNRPGGGGMLGTAAVVNARPDGYTIGGLWNAPLTMTPHLQQAPYKSTDYVAISLADTAPTTLCVKKDFPAKDAKEFFAHLKSNPGKVTYGNDGVGGTIQLTLERIFLKEGVKMRPVPFGGAGETLQNYLGGHVDVFGGSITTILPYVKDGSSRCLFVTGTERVASMPDVPSLTDLGMPGEATLLWHGVIGPKNLPPDRFAALEKAFIQAAKSDTFRQFMESRGIKVDGTTGAEFRKLIDDEFAAMGAVMKSIGLVK
ncbi:MAG: Bug family tripartite tricarboxylate transporter substrate binding protein [Lautropia sp.]